MDKPKKILTFTNSEYTLVMSMIRLNKTWAEINKELEIIKNA